MRLEGVLTAMITPFHDGAVDYDRLKRNVEEQIASGVDGLVPVGTTGESPTLSHDEHKRVVEAVVSAAEGRVPVVAGTGSNSTQEAVELTEHARGVGASAALMVNPYYNKPTQEGLYRHFTEVADRVELPIVLYNIPGRTGVTLSPATAIRLAEHPRIIAIKEATASMDIAGEILAGCDLTLLSGDDSLTLPLMSLGGRGVISVLSNLAPIEVKAMVQAGLENRWDEARAKHLALFPLFAAMFLETNPIPVKTALQMVGKDTGELRLPLCEMADEHRSELEITLREAKVLQ